MLLAGLLLALCVHVPEAAAATRTVRLTNDGPVPASLTVKAGDRVVFVNDDAVPHQVRSQDGWQYDSGPLPPGRTSSPTPALTAPGSYRYVDLRGIVFLPQTFGGRIVVPNPKPKPSPRPTPRPTPSERPQPDPTETPSPAASPATPSPSPTLTPSVTPTASPTPSAPFPTMTPPTAPPPTPVRDLRYGDPQALVQPSPHRYGLPALVAGIAIGGVLSLLARYLLSLPEGRRTGSS